MRSFVHWAASLAAAAALSLGVTQVADAQGTIRGRVVDAANQQPLSAVQVSVSGTTLGGATGLNGEFTIANVPAGERTLTARRIGYAQLTQTVTVTSGSDVRADMAMTVTATQLDKVVVTGTVLGAEQRTLGNSVTSVDVAELVTKAPVMNIAEILQGKTAGVQVLPGGGNPGAAGEIRIRGAGSLSGYKPMIYIDGIRYNQESLGNFSAGGFGVQGNSLALSSQVTSALDFLNPNDIESIEVLKGPSAATLYGAEAANGVINIITKKGTRGQQALRWTARYDRGASEWTLPIPKNYITCDGPRIGAMESGERMYPGCQGVDTGTVLVDSPIERTPDALRTGVLQRMAMSLTGGGDLYSFYLGGDRDTEEGVLHNSFNNRWSARGNFTFNPTEKVSFSVLMNFIQADLRLPLGDESPASVMFTGMRGQPGRRPVTQTVSPGWNSYDPGTSNEYNNRTKSDRLTLGGTVNYTPFTWFRNRLTVGIDNTVAQAALLYLPGDEGEPGGATLGRTPITRILSIDYGGSIPLTLPSDLELISSFGTQIVANRTETLAATGTGLGSPDVILIGNATTTSGSNGYSEANSVGYFLQEQLGWNNRLFVTGALRADDHSAFGSNFDWIVYPKLSLSWVASEEPALQSFVDGARLTTLKFRSAWGRAGRAPAPYTATQTYTVDRVSFAGGPAAALRILSYGNPDLKPEKGEELELGFDAGLLDDRLGIDFTYYDKVTTDMLAAVATAPSTGVPVNRTTNLGKVTNSGIELGITGTPVQTDNVIWDSRISFSTNKNRLVDFGIPGKTQENVTSPVGIQAYATVQQHREGYPLAGYWAQLPKWNDDGTPQVTAAGAVILDTATYIGPSTPNKELGFSNTVTLFRNFRVYALLDWKGGMYLFNQKERNRCQTAVDNCARVNQSLGSRVPKNAADSAAYRMVTMWRTVPGMFIEKADFTKLREVSVTYTVPTQYLGRLGPSGASITLSGRNLALWSDYSGIDPETNSYGGRTFLRVDAWATPNPRRFVGSVNLTF